MLEKYEVFIASLENTKDLSTISLTKVIHVLQAQEKRRIMGENHVVEGTLFHTGKGTLEVKNN